MGTKPNWLLIFHIQTVGRRRKTLIYGLTSLGLKICKIRASDTFMGSFVGCTFSPYICDKYSEKFGCLSFVTIDAIYAIQVKFIFFFLHKTWGNRTFTFTVWVNASLVHGKRCRPFDILIINVDLDPWTYPCNLLFYASVTYVACM